MAITKTILVCSFLFLLVVSTVYFSYSSLINPSPLDKIAKCLSEKDVVMYGTYWCTHCTSQKKMFGSSWRYIPYVECDSRANGASSDLCLKKNITSFPTWIFQEDFRLEGEVSIENLSKISNCR